MIIPQLASKCAMSAICYRLTLHKKVRKIMVNLMKLINPYLLSMQIIPFFVSWRQHSNIRHLQRCVWYCSSVRNVSGCPLLHVRNAINPFVITRSFSMIINLVNRAVVILLKSFAAGKLLRIKFFIVIFCHVTLILRLFAQFLHRLHIRLFLSENDRVVTNGNKP